LGVPNPDPPKLAVEGFPNVVTLPKETLLFSFGDGTASLGTSFAKGDDRSGEYDYHQSDPTRTRGANQRARDANQEPKCVVIGQGIIL